MGRDLTPKEHHDIDLRWGFAKRRLALKTTDGEEILMYDPDCEIAHRLPNLYYLFNKTLSGFSHFCKWREEWQNAL